MAMVMTMGMGYAFNWSTCRPIAFKQKPDQSGPGDSTSIRVWGRDYVSNGIYNAYDITHIRREGQ